MRMCLLGAVQNKPLSSIATDIFHARFPMRKSALVDDDAVHGIAAIRILIFLQLVQKASKDADGVDYYLLLLYLPAAVLLSRMTKRHNHCSNWTTGIQSQRHRLRRLVKQRVGGQSSSTRDANRDDSLDYANPHLPTTPSTTKRSAHYFIFQCRRRLSVPASAAWRSEHS